MQLDIKTILTAIGSLLVSVASASAHLHPTLAKFTQRDPLRYVDGMSLILELRAAPLTWRDPTGTDTDCGIVRCYCGGGHNVSVRLGSDWNGPPPGGGCITLGDGIHCSASCNDLKNPNFPPASSPGQPTPPHILNHECCHVCDLDAGLGGYVGGAICDTCNKRAKSAKLWPYDGSDEINLPV
jgi:hypothetical protein